MQTQLGRRCGDWPIAARRAGAARAAHGGHTCSVYTPLAPGWQAAPASVTVVGEVSSSAAAAARQAVLCGRRGLRQSGGHAFGCDWSSTEEAEELCASKQVGGISTRCWFWFGRALRRRLRFGVRRAALPGGAARRARAHQPAERAEVRLTVLRARRTRGGGPSVTNARKRLRHQQTCLQVMPNVLSQNVAAVHAPEVPGAAVVLGTRKV